MSLKTIIVYYSWSGNTEKLAKERAEKENAAICEVKDRRKPGTLGAYVAGCFAAMRMKGKPILPLNENLDDYEKIIVMGPVWAGHPAPAINTLLNELPSGKDVSVVMTSGSGNSSCKEKVESIIESRGSKLVEFTDIKC